MSKELELLETIKQTYQDGETISIISIQRKYAVGYPLAASVFNELKDQGYVQNDKIFVKKVNKSKTNPMKIYILSLDEKATYALKEKFDSVDDVEVINGGFKEFMDAHGDVECIVSPGNSFGLMDGGYDKAIINYFGIELASKAQKYISDHFYGEQVIAPSFIIKIPGSEKYLIHTPTMFLPSEIKDPLVIYQSMRSTLITALENNIQSIVIPAFGAGTGKAPAILVAKYMKAGYDQIFQ